MEQDVCETASAATHIDSHSARDMDLELFDCMLEFHASTGYPWVYLYIDVCENVNRCL